MLLTLQQATVNPCLRQRLPNTQRQVRFSLLWGHLSFLLGPGAHNVLFLTSQESVFPVLWKFCNQIPLTFKVRFPGDPQCLCLIPSFGSLLWDLELSQQCENFFSIIVLQFVSCPPGGSIVGLMVIFKGTYATRCSSQDCYCQSLCPCSRLLLTHGPGKPDVLPPWGGKVSDRT